MTILRPYYEREGVVLYHGRVEDIAPRLHRRGLVLSDPPYSPHVHASSRAGARKEPLTNGYGNLSPAALSRKVDFGFGHLTPELRRCLAGQARRLAARWALFFCDAEGLGAWRDDLDAAGLTYRTHLLWRKLCGTPQFTGMQSAIPDETIALAEVAEEITGGHIAVAHGDPDRDDAIPRRFWNGGGAHGYYEVPIVQARLGNRGPGAEMRVNETQKPERLIADLVSDWADPGELLIDLTAGGCTTLAVALQLGHPAIGIEAREEQCERAARRLEAVEVGSRQRANVKQRRNPQLVLGGRAA